MNTEDAGGPNHSVRILVGAFTAAVAINLVLLLLIGSLISRHESLQAAAPNPQPVDFIRIAPKAEEEPKPTPPKTIVENTPDPRPKSGNPASGPAKAPANTSQERPRRPSASKKPRKVKPVEKGVAAPRIDVPESGTGAPLAPVPGADSRLTAPPSQWNREKKPEPGDGRQDAGGRGGGGSDGRNLVVLHRVQPRYPSRAAARGVEGWVRLEVTVSPAGTVSDARVVDASPKGVFDRAALEAIRQWRFKPAFREGRAVEQQAEQTIRFRLEKPR